MMASNEASSGLEVNYKKKVQALGSRGI